MRQEQRISTDGGDMMKRTIPTLILALAILGGAIILTACKNSPVATPTLAPTSTRVNRVYQQVFGEAWVTINQTYFDPDFGGVNWDAVYMEYRALVDKAENDDELYQVLNQMLWELNVSHVGVGPVDVWPSVEPVVWESGKTGIDLRLLDDRAVITRVEAGSPAEQAGLRPGFIIQSIEYIPVEQLLAAEQDRLAPPYNDQSRIDQLTRSLLRLIYGDPGTCVTLAYLDEKDGLREDCIERIPRPRTGEMGDVLPPAYLEFESQRLENELGYIRFNTFHVDLIPDMVAAVAELQDAAGIIIDLRGNPGGDPTACEQLAAQFLGEQEILFGSFKTRSGVIDRRVTGENVYPGPLVILIDSLSFSGSEYFSSSMQALHRGVIIGERSPGGLTAMNVTSLSNGAFLGYPVAQLLTPDGMALEGYGVIPDIAVVLERDQLLAGVDAQLKAAIDTILEAGQ
jgi:carboxyl-terminal processing protease